MEKYLNNIDKTDELTKIIKSLLEETDIKNFLNKENITPEVFEANLNTFLGYSVKSERCHGCKGLASCHQNHQGYQPILIKDEDIVNIAYVKCPFLLHQNVNHLTLVGLKLEDGKMYINEKRQYLLSLVQEYLMDKNVNNKGLYIYGKYGVGKTYIMLYLAHKFAENGHDVFMGYYPEMVRLIKNAIGNNGLADIVEYLKKIEILIIDDFGGEVASNYIRDEVIGPILQERMVNKRLTFMTSNLSPEQIQEHLAEGNKDIDKTRASRVFERMRTLMNFIELDDKNYRI